jgi:hypothetical protein
MRPLLPLAMLTSLLVTTTVQAAEPRLWTLQVDPLTTALGFVHLQVERAVDPRWSVYVGPHLRLFDGLLDATHQPYIGLGVELGVRRFLTGAAPEGVWLEVRGVGARLRAGEDRAFGGYVSALGGITHVFDNGFVLAGGLGVQYLHYTIDGYGQRGVLPAAHTTVGFAF